jgi:transposase
MDDGIGHAEKMLGLEGVRVLDVEERPGELVVTAETTRTRGYCPSCRKRAKAHDRTEIQLRDLHCFGRPVRLILRKRRWRCTTKGCLKKTWTEKIAGIVARQLLTHRAGAEATRQVGQLCRSVRSVAAEYGVGWDTVMSTVVRHGTPLVDDPHRVGVVRALGVDEHSYLAATPEHHTIYATSLVDLDRRRVIDLFEGKSAQKLRNWTGKRSKRWLSAVKVVALDLTDTYRSGLHPHLSHARRVADPFHVVRVGNRLVDEVRRRVQNETMGHRGKKDDPLYRARKLLIRGDERLDERGREKLMEALRRGDPFDEVLGAWLAKEACRSIYMEDDVEDAAVILDDTIAGSLEDPVAEIRTFGRTLSRWREEILNHHRTGGASNGPTEGTNFCAKQVKRAGRGFTRFSHYRLRVLLYAGGVTWPRPILAPRITSSRPH